MERNYSQEKGTKMGESGKKEKKVKVHSITSSYTSSFPFLTEEKGFYINYCYCIIEF